MAFLRIRDHFVELRVKGHRLDIFLLENNLLSGPVVNVEIVMIVDDSEGGAVRTHINNRNRSGVLEHQLRELVIDEQNVDIATL